MCDEHGHDKPNTGPQRRSLPRFGFGKIDGNQSKWKFFPRMSAKS